MAKWQTHRSDNNEREIVEALKGVGASVEKIGRPLDLLVGWRGKTLLVEIKQPKGAIRPSQKAFMDGWRGQVAVIRSIDEALALLAANG